MSLIILRALKFWWHLPSVPKPGCIPSVLHWLVSSWQSAWLAGPFEPMYLRTYWWGSNPRPATSAQRIFKWTSTYVPFGYFTNTLFFPHVCVQFSSFFGQSHLSKSKCLKWFLYLTQIHASVIYKFYKFAKFSTRSAHKGKTPTGTLILRRICQIR